ncbi:hypothetical protein BVG16_13605 [Paenibacillus selenitireducens]|uniref:Uncharacterized protein n=1 Tax=Paenibacillus selenitireducens TaxID=1324314 RepID=A0A1T2XCD3_9BACL|nr:hypothetical protein [Paenibacillus selenitireducens]OPA77485.1 hypothetical protein BVG16_13605 [Paenibacillus selenitireducens]
MVKKTDLEQLMVVISNSIAVIKNEKHINEATQGKYKWGYSGQLKIIIKEEGSPNPSTTRQQRLV